MPLGSIGQLDLSAAHCEAAVELAGLLERRRELEVKLGQVDVDERSAAQEAQRLSGELAQMERRAAVGEPVAAKDRAALEQNLARAKAAAAQPWAERRAGLNAAARDLDQQVRAHVGRHFDELLDELEQDAAAPAEAMNVHAVGIVAAAEERARCARQVEALVQIVRGSTQYGDVEPLRAEALVREAERLLSTGGELAPTLREELRGNAPAADVDEHAPAASLA